ncbi:prephenate dehydrogenase [Gordonia sp. PKS22-38]|uniref:Prephenate dehydrogenase n=1 Tax=Gordonia prachuapensis TaxID=3115651 RepID=A0ABU7MU60_9ACTN|nr:prephenate dehydrogenase [Gordonia sp. PKS22-38]
MTAASASPRPASGPICVLGLGLIGGSLIRALDGGDHPVFGYNRSAETVEAAVAAGHDASTDLVSTLDRAAADDALLVLATPATTIDDLLPEIAAHAPNCLLTDVISVKQAVAAAVSRHAPGLRYVGGHPMAGTSRSGWSATDPDLFRSAMWMVSTEDDTDPADWSAVAAMARSVGAFVVPAAADAHDRAVAAISHLPHLTAAATAAVGAGESDLALRLAAGSFRDGTRVAGTAPTLQRAMLEANGIALLNVLSETIDRLVAARDELREHGTVEILVDDGHRSRLAYEKIAGADPAPITGVHIGEPGWAQELRRQAHQGRVWLD